MKPELTAIINLKQQNHEDVKRFIAIKNKQAAKAEAKRLKKQFKGKKFSSSFKLTF